MGLFLNSEKGPALSAREVSDKFAVMLVGAGLLSLISITYGTRAAARPRAWDCVTGTTESSAQPEPHNNGSFEPHNNENTNRIYVNHGQSFWSGVFLPVGMGLPGPEGLAACEDTAAD